MYLSCYQHSGQRRSGVRQNPIHAHGEISDVNTSAVLDISRMLTLFLEWYLKTHADFKQTPYFTILALYSTDSYSDWWLLSFYSFRVHFANFLTV